MRLIIVTIIVLVGTGAVLAQTGLLRGQVTDQNGAVVPAAKIELKDATGVVKAALTDSLGRYSIAGLPAGEYVVKATAPSLGLPQPVVVMVTSGVNTLDLQLSVTALEEKVTVDERAALSTESGSNANAQVLKGDDLDALPDSPEELEAALLALAGPAAGPSGGAIFIDGFSGGVLPSKESIREIRINQNPFSPEFDRLGFGRIEILTKPGADTLHASAFYNFAHHFWNTRNPYAMQKAPFLLHEYGGSASGAINRRGSFFVDFRRDYVDNGSIINAVILDAQSLAIIPFTATFRTLQRRISVTPRIDWQLNAKNTLTARYSLQDADILGAGIGGFNLTSRGTHPTITSHTLQLTETLVLRRNVINETRFQFFRSSVGNTALDQGPGVQVLGAFNGGGAQVGRSLDKRTSLELQNYTSIIGAMHTLRFGARVRRESVDTISQQNFGGSFSFAGGTGPPLDANNLPVAGAAPVSLTSIERYRRTLLFQRFGYTPAQIRALGGGATQFSINAGDPQIAGSQTDVGLFFGDEWRVRPGLTMSLGLRYEWQNNIRDLGDLSPRFALAWAPGQPKGNGTPKTVFRAGLGVFYDRFGLGNTLTTQRYNGVVQRQYVVANPDFFPAIPSIASLGALQTVQTIWQKASTLQAPRIVQAALSLERQLEKNTTLAVTYSISHGSRMLRSEVLAGPVFLMGSTGRYNQNQLIVNVNSRINSNLSFNSSYVLNKAKSDTDGLGTFPARPGDLTGEYGAASTDVRHRFTFNGTINTWWNVRLSPFVVLQTGAPFDITVGRDIYGTTLFNARPGIATDPTRPGVIQTRYGLLDPNPIPGQATLPRNFGRGPGSITANLRILKVIQFGQEGTGRAAAVPTTPPGGPDNRATPGVFTPAGQAAQPAPIVRRRYTLNITMSINNILNHTNPGPIIGNITSPLFGQANQPSGGGGTSGGLGFSEAANNRRLELQLRLSF